MKMKNLLLSLSLAGLCFSQASAQGISHPTSTSARHIGDGVQSIGDSNRYVPLSQDQRPAEFKPTANTRPISQVRTLDAGMLAPTANSRAVQTASYGSGGGLVSSGITNSNLWFSGETLLWWGQKQVAPPLMTTSAQAVRPIAGNNGVTTQVGGPNGIDSGLLPGFRLAGGMYLGDCQKVGIGGRVFGIFSNNTSYTNTSDGSTSLGLPFYNLQVQQNDAYLVGFHDGIELVSTGTATARADLDMFGTDGSLHLLLGRSSGHRADLLIGYTYNRLRNSVAVTSQSTNFATGDGIPNGTVFTTNDLFETDNTFNGAHLGVLSSVTTSRVSLSTLAKVSFGNMRQESDVRGYTLEAFGGNTNTYPGGVYTQTSNIGPSTRDAFAFIPELGLKLGLACNENIQFTVGYTFMFWSSVGMAGQQIDPTVDLLQVGGRPAFNFQDSSFWMQGIDLGLTMTF